MWEVFANQSENFDFCLTPLLSLLETKLCHNNVLGTNLLCSLVPEPAKAGGSYQNTMLIIQKLLIMWDPESGRS